MKDLALTLVYAGSRRSALVLLLLACSPVREADDGPRPAPARDAAAQPQPGTPDAAADAATVPPPPSGCGAGTLACGEGLQRCTAATFSFETGNDGWSRPDGFVTHSTIGPLVPHAGQAHAGGKSLSSELTVSPYQGIIELNHWFCGHGPTALPPRPAVDLTGRTLVAWVYFETTSGTGLRGRCSFTGYADAETPRQLGTGKVTDVLGDAWTEIRTPIDEPFAQRGTDLTVRCQMRADTARWTGRLYFDDVSVL